MSAKAAAAVVLVWGVTAHPASADDLEQQARDAIAAKQFREAATFYETLAAREPANADYLVWIGRLSGWLQNYQAALDTYDRALQLAPQNVEALVGKATVLMWQQKFPDADRALADAEQLEPESVAVQIALARCLLYQHLERLASAHVRLALAIEPGNEEARELETHIVVPRPLDVSAAFGLDESSFAHTGNMGYLGAAYSSSQGRIGAQYERWNKFGEVVDRAGASVSRRLAGHLWARASSMFAPGAHFVARRDLSGGLSRSWTNGFVLNADYRRLDFADAHVNVATPGVEYYVAHRPVRLSASLSESRTRFTAGGRPTAANHSFMIQYHQQVAAPAALRVGYARGNESFAALSIDQIGTFRANTVLGGFDIRLTPASSLSASYTFQQRSNGATQQTVGLGVSVRR
jgi:YaiO family outer membrane protein